MSPRALLLFAAMAVLLLAVGQFQSWTVALTIFNLCLISAVMALGVNVQWGYAGLFNVGTMGFAALGGLAAMLVSMPPVQAAWTAGGGGMILSALIIAATAAAVVAARRWLAPPLRGAATVALILIGFLAARHVFGPAADAIENVDAARFGFLGGLGMPIIFSWLVGGLFAAGAAWFIGKIALGLRADYLAIATLGISEIIIAILRNEDWLTRGVKNVTGLNRPVPREVDLQQASWFLNLSARLGIDPVPFSSLFVKLCYAGLFATVLLLIVVLLERAYHSPWGRMMRALRDNPKAAAAMGKDVKWRQLQAFVLGSAIVGVAGAMLTTLDGQFTPGSYNPLRYTFLIWVMVILGGSGNNLGSVLGGFLIWFLWVQAEPAGRILMEIISSQVPKDFAFRVHLLEASAHLRLFLMGFILILALRFFPQGLLPEEQSRRRPRHVP